MIKRLHFSKITFIVILGCLMISGCAPTKRMGSSPQYTHKHQIREYANLHESQIDSLELLYGGSKKFVDEFKEASLIALSHYPELKNTKIEFSYSNESTTMAARPKIRSLFGKRIYQILINNKKEFHGIHLQDVPFNAQIGIIGHELAHIFDYEQQSLLGLIRTGIHFVNKQKKADFERKTDRITIERGLGYQLYDWALFSMFLSEKATSEYKEFKKNTYLNPTEIENMINVFN